jgi:hypothetical protein
MKKILKAIKDLVSPGYWAEKIGTNSGLYTKAKNSKLRKWVDNLQGWKWWAWQLIVGGVFFILIELILNTISMTILPWK